MHRPIQITAEIEFSLLDKRPQP